MFIYDIQIVIIKNVEELQIPEAILPVHKVDEILNLVFYLGFCRNYNSKKWSEHLIKFQIVIKICTGNTNSKLYVGNNASKNLKYWL
jgi:hypothetical protein